MSAAGAVPDQQCVNDSVNKGCRERIRWAALFLLPVAGAKGAAETPVTATPATGSLGLRTSNVGSHRVNQATTLAFLCGTLWPCPSLMGAVSRTYPLPPVPGSILNSELLTWAARVPALQPFFHLEHAHQCDWSSSLFFDW